MNNDDEKRQRLYSLEATINLLGSNRTPIYVSGVLPNGSSFDNMPLLIDVEEEMTKNERLANEYFSRQKDYDDSLKPIINTVRECFANGSFKGFTTKLAQRRAVKEMGLPEIPLNAHATRQGPNAIAIYGSINGNKTTLTVEPNSTSHDLANDRHDSPIITEIHIKDESGSMTQVYESPAHYERTKLKDMMRASNLAERVAYYNNLLEVYCGKGVLVKEDGSILSNLDRIVTGNDLERAINYAVNLYAFAKTDVELDKYALQPLEVTAPSRLDNMEPRTVNSLYVGSSTSGGGIFLQSYLALITETSEIKVNGEALDYKPDAEASKLKKVLASQASLTPREIFAVGVEKAKAVLGLGDSHEKEEERVSQR